MSEKQSAEKMIELYKQIEDENIITTYLSKEKEKEKEETKKKLNDEFNKITYIEYEIENPTSPEEIDFLFDYCKIICSDKNDSKIYQWQVMNKDRLFPYGVNVMDLMSKINSSLPKGANNKLDNIISNLNYRLQRHGRLAPTKDIARRLDKKSEDQLPLDEEEGENDADIELEEDINTNEDMANNNTNNNTNTNNNNIKNVIQENYYDINDPFIDDNLDELSEGDDNKLLFKITLPPGNYTENQIMKNLKKYLRPKKNFKRIKPKIHNEENEPNNNNNNTENDVEKIDYDHSDNYVDITEYTKNNNKIQDDDKEKNADIINYINNGRQTAADRESMIENILGQTMLQKKTKREPSNGNNTNINEQQQGDNEKKSYKKKKIDKNQLLDLNVEKIVKVINDLKEGLSLNTDHEKETFIRRNVKILSEIYEQYPKYLFIVLQRELDIDYDISEYLLEYEIFKSKTEYIYSNFSKFLNKLCVTMKNYGISQIASVGDLYKFCNIDVEIEKCLRHVIHNIYDFRQAFNLYIGKHYLDLATIHEKLSKYIKDIKERNKGLILKLSYKFDELEKDFSSLLDRKIILDYFFTKYTNEDFGEDFSNDKNRIYSLDSFIFKEKGNNVKIYLENEDLNHDMNNIGDTLENKDDEKMLYINTEDASYKTYDNSAISSPSKSFNSNNNDGTVHGNISVNIKKTS